MNDRILNSLILIDLKDECTTSSVAEDDAGTSGSWGYAGRGIPLVV